MAESYQTFRQVRRLYSKQIITESGIYKEGELPEAKKGSAQLTVEVVHEVVLSDRAGRLQRLMFYVPEAMDKDDQVGGGYELNGSAYITDDYTSASGPSEIPTKLYVDTKTTLSNSSKISADAMVGVAGGWPTKSTSP